MRDAIFWLAPVVGVRIPAGNTLHARPDRDHQQVDGLERPTRLQDRDLLAMVGDCGRQRLAPVGDLAGQ